MNYSKTPLDRHNRCSRQLTVLKNFLCCRSTAGLREFHKFCRTSDVVHGRYAIVKKVPSTLAKGYVCERCVEAIKGIVEPDEEGSFHDQVELVMSFCYLERGGRLKTSGKSKAAMTV